FIQHNTAYEMLLCLKETPWQQSRFKKARKAIELMRNVGPSHPGFKTHQMSNLRGPNGHSIWNSYVENATPKAWRMYWIYDGDGGIFILSMGPHTHTPGVQPSVDRRGEVKKR